MKALVSVATLLATLTCAIALHADSQPPDKTYKDIKQALGVVPTFVKAVPDEGVASAWNEWSAIEISSNTALPGKTKELIGLGVAAQVPCRYCVYAHTTFAKANGASDREIREAVAIAAAWREQKGFELNPTTALPNKTKELIGLAVAAQIPCRYCVTFHTQAAKLAGATHAEIQEAVAMSALTRHWSTILNGTLQDENQFRHEVDQALKNPRKPPAQAQR